MTRKQYKAIAQKLLDEYRRTDHSSGEVRLLRRLIPQIGEAISATAGLDINGNRKVTIQKFVLEATGDHHFADLYWGQTTAHENPYPAAAEYQREHQKTLKENSGA